MTNEIEALISALMKKAEELDATVPGEGAAALASRIQYVYWMMNTECSIAGVKAAFQHNPDHSTDEQFAGLRQAATAMDTKADGQGCSALVKHLTDADAYMAMQQAQQGAAEAIRQMERRNAEQRKQLEDRTRRLGESGR